MARDLGVVPASAVAQHLAFIVVDGDPGGLLDELAQLGAVEARQLLARIEHERNALRRELGRMLHHRVATVRRDDAQPDVAAWRDLRSARPAPWRPGGKPLIWLLSTSVMIMACAV
jgi:hypothetical protein